MAGTLSAGNILLDAGTNSAPAIAATSSPTVGIVFPAANTIAISTASTERLRIDSSGRLGIGITSPTSNLHVIGANIASAVITSPTISGTPVMSASVITSGTANTNLGTGSTTVDFTGIPSWVKRVTVIFQGVSTNGTSSYQVQIGAGSVTTSGYASVGVSTAGTALATTAYTSGFVIVVPSAATNLNSGALRISNLTGNTWVAEGVVASTDTNRSNICAGSIALGGALDRVRITTVNGTDTFDAGSINILYE